MKNKNVSVHNNFVLAKVAMTFLLIQIFGIMICYAQDRTATILEVKNSIFKIDYLLNEEGTSYQQFVAVLSEDNVAYKEWKRGRTLNSIGNLITVPSIVFFGLGIANMGSDDEIASGLAPAMLLGGLGGSIIGITLIITGNNKTLEAIDGFNQKSRVRLGLLNNGTNLGVVFSLNKMTPSNISLSH